MSREHWDAEQTALYVRNNRLQEHGIQDNWKRLGNLKGKRVLDIGCGKFEID